MGVLCWCSEPDDFLNENRGETLFLNNKKNLDRQILEALLKLEHLKRNRGLEHFLKFQKMF